MLVLDGAPICIRELLFLLTILPKEYRDIFVLTFEGNPNFAEKFAEGTMQKRQWQKYESGSAATIYEWLRLNVTRIGGAELEFNLNNPQLHDDANCQRLIHEQLEIERVRNPSLVAVWMANQSETPFHKVQQPAIADQPFIVTMESPLKLRRSSRPVRKQKKAASNGKSIDHI